MKLSRLIATLLRSVSDKIDPPPTPPLSYDEMMTNKHELISIVKNVQHNKESIIEGFIDAIADGMTGSQIPAIQKIMRKILHTYIDVDRNFNNHNMVAAIESAYTGDHSFGSRRDGDKFDQLLSDLIVQYKQTLPPYSREFLIQGKAISVNLNYLRKYISQQPKNTPGDE